MNDIVYQFGRKVRAQREHLAWSQEKLAEEAGLNRSYLGEIERGNSIPSLVTIVKLASALKIAPSELFERPGH